jgi:hypothetical protein
MMPARVAVLSVLLSIPHTLLFAQPTVAITSPADGAVVSSGQTLTVTVNATASAFESVMVGASAPLVGIWSLTASPYQFQVPIPPDIASGPCTLVASGIVGAGNAVDSAPITVDIERPDNPQQLTPGLSTIGFRYAVGTVPLLVTGTYADGSIVSLSKSALTTYASDTPAVASVDTYGRVTAVGPGSASITITNAGVSVQVPVTVPQPITIIPASMSLYPSQAQPFYAHLAFPAAITNPSVTWSISPALGSVDSTGLYTPPSSVDSVQSVTLTATSVADNTQTASAQIWIFPPISPLTISPTSVTMLAGQTQQFLATIANAAPTATWSISPPGAQSGWINSANGFYNAPDPIPSPLTVTVTAVSVADNTKTASAQVTLVPSASVSISPTSATLYASQTQQFTAALTVPGDSVTWSVTPAVGTINASGLYSAPSLVAYQQTVTITAFGAADGYTASATVTLLPTVSSAITVPSALAATPASVSEIDLSWSGSSEPGATIAGYSIFRNGTWAGSSSTTSYSDLGLLTATQYTYTVAAYDTQGNNSAPSAAVSATTLSGPVVSGLVAWYNFNEGTGAALHDSSGNGNNAVIQDTTSSGAATAPTWTSSQYSGSALVFDGRTSAAAPDSASLDPTTGLTLEAWVNPTALTDAPLIYKADGRYSLYLYYGTPGAQLNVTTSGEVDGTSPLATNVWTHLATTYDGTTQNLFVNGVLVATQPQTGAITSQGQPATSLLLGTDTYWDFFSGAMDGVRIYNYALSQAQIQSDMQAGSAPVSVSLSPTAATLYASQTQQFTASVANTTNTAVTWSFSPSAGTLGASGLYTAPASIAAQQTVTVTATSQADTTKLASATITLMPPIAVTVGPASASLYASQTQQFTATVVNATNTAVTWSISPAVGTVSATGLYTAPSAIAAQQTVTVTATSQADNTTAASAAITLLPPVAVSVTPASATLYASQTQAFTATVANTTNTAVTWALSPAVGTIDASGLYTAPNSISAAQTVTATATSVADGTKSASAQISLVQSSWYNASWAGRKQIVLDHTKVSGSANLTGFPVLISSTDPDFRSQSNGGWVGTATGGDILFTAADGVTKLAHEIESYDPVAGQLVAWVNVPTLSPSADTVLFLYLGNPGAADQQNAAGVWSGGYAGVWHLANTVNNGTTTVSGLNSVSGASATLSNVSPVAGQAGGGAGFNGGNSYINAGTPAALDITGAITVSAWVYPTGFGGGSRGRIVDKTNNSSPGYVFFADNSDTTDGITWSSNDSALEPAALALYPVGSWRYVVASYDGANTTLSICGFGGPCWGVQSNAYPAPPNTSSAPLYIGNRPALDRGFAGTLDEVRISNTARSSDWIQTEYNNQISPSGFQSTSATGGGSAVLVSPASATLTPSQTRQFTPSTPVSWSSPSAGSISASGLYTAPAIIDSQQTVTLTATSQADSTKTAAVAVTLAPLGTVTVSPSNPSLGASQTQQFTAAVTGISNTAVSWSISPSVGSISVSGLYTAPSSVTSQQKVTVTATSQANSAWTASATVTLTP